MHGTQLIINRINDLGKIQASVIAQQGQQWCMTWLAQLRQLILQLYEDQHIQHTKDIVLGMAASIQNTWQEIQLQYYNVQWNTLDFYRQLGTLYVGKGTLNTISDCVSRTFPFIKLLIITHLLLLLNSYSVQFQGEKRCFA